MTRVALTSTLVLSILVLVKSRIFTPCELGVELTKSKYNVSFWQIPTWVCLAHHATGYNSSYNQFGYLGIFRLSTHWCEKCDVSCDKLTDDDIEDDISCAVNVVYQKHHGAMDGFSAWGNYYDSYCKEPWKDLQSHDCHKLWNLLVLRYPKIRFPADYDTTDSSPESSSDPDELTPTEEYYNLTTEPPGSFAFWGAHHVIFSDAGLMIIILTLILAVAGLIEIWRRRELPFARFCMNA